MMTVREFTDLLPKGCDSYPIHFFLDESPDVKEILPAGVGVKIQHPDRTPSIAVTFDRIE